MARDRNVELIGGDLALDFANTVGWHARKDPVEHLERYADFTAWARRAGVISAADEAALGRQAGRAPQQAARALKRIRSLRESIYRVFTAVAARKRPGVGDLRAIQDAVAHATGSANPVWQERGGVQLVWTGDAAPLDWPAYPVALAAGALLASPLLTRLRQCGNHPCGWLFVDRTRNASRRWCTSAECGNASRVRRFRARRR